MKKVIFRYFAAVRECLNLKEEKVNLDVDTVEDALKYLYNRHGEKLIPLVMNNKGELNVNVRLLVNGALCPVDKISIKKVSDGDELVLMPPVAGG